VLNGVMPTDSKFPSTGRNQDTAWATKWAIQFRKRMPLKIRNFLVALMGEEILLLLILDLGTRWDESSAPRPGRALPPGKGPPVPCGQETWWAPELVWTQRLEEKSFVSPENRAPNVQSVVSYYTDWATPLQAIYHGFEYLWRWN
jgi:hypothetical protein